VGGAQANEPDWSAVLLDLLKREHCNIPAGAWGFFFPVMVALWRLINRMTNGQTGEVHAIWVDKAADVPSEIEVFGDKYLVRRGVQEARVEDGPGFLGAGGTWLVAQVEGSLLEAVEKVAYAMVAAAPQEKALSGRLRPSDIAEVDPGLVTHLAALAGEAARRCGVPS